MQILTVGVFRRIFFSFFFLFLSGGEQERDAATEAVKRGAPEATVRQVRLNNYPVFVRVSLEKEGGQKTVLWEKPQRNLFQKYPQDRKRSQKEIQDAVIEALEEKD